MSAANPSIYKKLTTLLIVGFLTFTFALGGTALAIINMGGNIGASTSIALFGTNGAINTTQAQNILNNLNAARTNVVNRDTQFRLFSSTGTADVNRLSNLNWRMTNISGDRVTFWASGAYRDSVFHPVLGQASSVYSTSQLRDNVLANFTTLTSGWTPAVRDANILTQGTSTNNANTSDRMWIPSAGEVQNLGTWGLSNAQRGYTANGFDGTAWLRNMTAWGSDTTAAMHWRERIRIGTCWYVSYGYYDCNYGYSGWTTNQSSLRPIGHSWTEDGGCSWYSDDGSWCQGGWITINHIVTGHQSQMITIPGTFGSASHVNLTGANVNGATVSGNRAVRPALHISLAALDLAVNPPLATPTNINLNENTLTWNAVTGATGYAIYRGTTRVGTVGNVTTANMNTWWTWPTTGSQVIGVRALHSNTAQNSAIGAGPNVTFATLGVPAPTLTGSILSWPAITHATHYEIAVGSGVAPPIVTTITGTSVDLSNHITEIGDHVIRIRATNNLFNHHDSAWNTVASAPVYIIRFSHVFVTTTDITQNNTILMNILFPTQIDYRTELRVGDWIKSIHGSHPIMRQVDAIGSGANPIVILGMTIASEINPAEGLAELISYTLSLNLTSADFDNNADWNTFTRALFYAENATHNLSNLTVTEVKNITEALRDALDLRT